MNTSLKKKQISLEQIIAFIFFLGVFFIPFNSFEGISFLGEFKNEASFYFFFLAFFLLIISAFLTKKITIPYKNILFQFLIIILFWFLLSTIFNINNIKDYYFKKTGGPYRFIRQYGVLLISSFFLLLTYYNVIIKYSVSELLYKIRTVILYSLIIVSAYAFIETLIIYLKISQLKPVLDIFSYFPFTEAKLDTHRERISSVTFEAPALAAYLFTISGWMFSYIITNKKLYRFIPTIVVLILALLSGSRSGIAIVGAQGLLFFILLLKKRKYHQLVVKISLGFLIIIFCIGIFKGKEITTYIGGKMTSFSLNDDKHSISNRSRFGTQYALYQVFLDNPISGVGFGQQAFESVSKYPFWATSGNWEFKYFYFNLEEPRFPPGYNLYLRILAESGSIGFILFILFLAFILFLSYTLYARNDNNKGVLALIIFISMLGFYIGWTKEDSFKIFGFWINFAILMLLTKDIVFNLSNKQDKKLVKHERGREI